MLIKIGQERRTLKHEKLQASCAYRDRKCLIGTADIHVSAHFSAHISSVTAKYLTEQKMFGAKVVETDKLPYLPSISFFYI